MSTEPPESPGLFSQLLSAIKDRTIARNDWAIIVGTVVIGSLIYRLHHATPDKYVPLDAWTFWLLIFLFILLGTRPTGK